MSDILFCVQAAVFAGESFERLIDPTPDTPTVFSALRLFAVTNRNKAWLVIVLGLGLVPVCTNLVSFSFQQFHMD